MPVNAGAVIAVAVAIAVSIIAGGLVTIPEGHVGVIYRGGRLLDTVLTPGIHVKLPFLDTVAPVDVNLQVDRVTDVDCGVKSGASLVFASIEVVNKLSSKPEDVIKVIRAHGLNYDGNLIFDRVAHAMLEICSQSSLQDILVDKFSSLDETLRDVLIDYSSTMLGDKNILSIHAVRVSKPRVPEGVRRAMEAQETERANHALALSRAKVLEVEAQAALRVRQIALERELLEREHEKKVAEMRDATHIASEKARADSALYTAQKQAEANKLLLTKEKLELEKFKSLSNNLKIYFGEKIPSTFLSNAIKEGDDINNVNVAAAGAAGGNKKN